MDVASSLTRSNDRPFHEQLLIAVGVGAAPTDVRYWHKADIKELPANVCFFGGKADMAIALRDVCFWPKADILLVLWAIVFNLL
jgi:hypothetical protein